MLPHSMAARRNFMRKREELVKDRQLALDKAKGSLCGLAIGDSFGDAARKPDFQRDYGITTDFQKGAEYTFLYGYLCCLEDIENRRIKGFCKECE